MSRRKILFVTTDQQRYDTVGCNGGTIRAPRLPVFAAQTIIGCLVARAVTGDIVFRFLKDWPLFLSVVVAIVAAGAGLGWLLTRWKVLPGTTAVWGMAPGGACWLASSASMEFLLLKCAAR